jgi:hypothetical protein
MRVRQSNTRKSQTEEKLRRRISKSQGDGARWASTAAKWRINPGERPRKRPLPGARPIPRVLEDAEPLIAAWNERQAAQMPMLFSPTIGAAVTAGYWFLWVRCPACRTLNAIDLRTLDRHADGAISSLIPAVSCRSRRPHAPFAELVRLSRTSIADEMRIEHTRQVLGE